MHGTKMKIIKAQQAKSVLLVYEIYKPESSEGFIRSDEPLPYPIRSSIYRTQQVRANEVQKLNVQSTFVQSVGVCLWEETTVYIDLSR